MNKNKTDLLNRYAKDNETRKHFATCLDKIEQRDLRQVQTFTPFFNPEEAEDFIALLNHLKQTSFQQTGGYPSATRSIFCFPPPWQEIEDWATENHAPLLVIHGKCRESVGHSDVLGSLMGLGLTRRKFGDILLQDNQFQLIVLEEVAPILLSQWSQVGRQNLSLTQGTLQDLKIPQTQFKEITSTVATLRLDSLVATGFSLPRSKAVAQISAGAVSINHRECKKPDKQVSQGDILVCRGYGKCMVEEVSGTSKKGRIIVHLKKFM